MSSLEVINVLSKPWADVNDIKKLANCGRDKASLIRDDIRNNIVKEVKLLPICKSKLIPMERLVKYLNLNIDYIYSMAEKEKKLI